MPDSAYQRLENAVEFLNDDEMEVLCLVAEGLARGQKVYGPLDIDSDERDFEEEALEEIRDSLVYQAAHAVRLYRKLGE